MRIDVLTLFPGMFGDVLGASILGRAARPVPDPAAPNDPARLRQPVASYHLHDLRQWTDDPHGKVDDASFGGGPGMVIRCQPVWDAVTDIEAMDPTPPTRIVLSPQGDPLTQPLAEQLAQRDRLLLLCGHYEGFDQRVLEALREPRDGETEPGLREISLGDYVLSGGELPAMVLIDAIVRLLPGALGDAGSARADSFSPGVARLLDHPHYTRPRVWQGRETPEVLLSGDHEKIDTWRRTQSEKATRQRRPDLMGDANDAPASQQTIGKTPAVVLREAVRADAQEIDDLLLAALEEPETVDAVRKLRKRRAMILELVAEVDGRIVGHAGVTEAELAETPATAGWLCLAPVAVDEAWRGRGVGGALVRRAVALLRDDGMRALVVLGDPAYYQRFGFSPAPPQGLHLAAFPQAGDAFQLLELRDGALAAASGAVRLEQEWEALASLLDP